MACEQTGVRTVHAQLHSGRHDNAKGTVTGALANLVIPPIGIEALGNDAMLDFGEALFGRKPTFTFPKARNLQTGEAAQGEAGLSER